MAEAIAGELTCSICLELFDDPRSLPCLHSFCKKCLQDIFLKGEASGGLGHREVVCPNCRKQILITSNNDIEGLPKNFLLANITEKYKDAHKKKDKGVPCDICDNRPPEKAVKTCVSCAISYCEGCLSALHPKKGVLARHKMVDPSLKEAIYSSDSREDTGELQYCESCNAVFRSFSLQATDHIEHDFQTIEVASETRRELMTVQLSRLEEMKESLVRDAALLDRRLNSNKATSLKMEEKVTFTYNQMIRQMRDQIEQRRLRTESASKQIQEQLEYVRTCIEKLQLLGELDDEDLLLRASKKLVDDLQERLPGEETISEEFFEDSECLDSNYNTDLSNITQMVRQLTCSASGDCASTLYVTSPTEKATGADGLEMTSHAPVNKQEVSEKGTNIERPSSNTFDEEETNSEEQAKLVGQENTFNHLYTTVSKRLTKTGTVIDVNWHRLDDVALEVWCTRVSPNSCENVVISPATSPCTVDNLKYSSTYEIYLIAVIGTKKVKKKLTTVTTHPLITYPDISFVGFSCIGDVKMSKDFRSLHAKEDIEHASPVRAVGKFAGVLTSARMTTGIYYWELEISLTVNRRIRVRDALFDFGICDSSAIGKSVTLYDNRTAFSCHLIQRDNSAVLECTDKTKDMDVRHRISLSYNRPRHFLFQFLLNFYNGTFSVVLQEEDFEHKWYNVSCRESFIFALRPACPENVETDMTLKRPTEIETISEKML